MLARWGIYILEMYQPLTRLIFASLSSASIGIYLWIHFQAPALFETRLWGQGILSMMLILLYYRICDEFKDRDTDAQFFPQRPLPSGRVKYTDLTILKHSASLAGLALNLIWPTALGAYLLVYGYAWLMGRWFFWPPMADKRLIAFVTHSPIAFWGYFYLYHLFGNASDPAGLPIAWGFLLWIAWPGMIWELARKTRAPENEQAGYQTYSVILGARGAAAMTLIFVALQAALSAYVWTDFSIWVQGLLGLGLSLMVLSLLAFIWQPLRFQKSLQPIAEVLVGVVLLAYPLSYWLMPGLAG